MKKILVLSDSHAAMSFMRRAVQALKPDALIHLGDYYDDGETVAQENPHIPFHQVPGNCDRYRCPSDARPILCYDICGVRLYMTHGHLHHVKSTQLRLLQDARKLNAAAALYGHTHEAYCQLEEDGLWVMNPGSCGSYGGSVGLIKVEDGRILSCSILRYLDLPE